MFVYQRILTPKFEHLYSKGCILKFNQTIYKCFYKPSYIIIWQCVLQGQDNAHPPAKSIGLLST